MHVLLLRAGSSAARYTAWVLQADSDSTITVITDVDGGDHSFPADVEVLVRADDADLTPEQLQALVPDCVDVDAVGATA